MKTNELDPRVGRTTTVVLLGALLILCTHATAIDGAEPSAPTAELGEMNTTCLIAIPPDKDSGLTAQQLRDVLLVALKSKMPRLNLGACEEIVTVSAVIVTVKNVGGTALGHAGYVEVQVERWATIRKTGAVALLPVWSDGMLFAGPKGTQTKEVNEAIDDLATRLAAAYYKAGNE